MLMTMNSLLQGPFLHSITKNKPRDHSELLARANKYILIEDLDETRHELRMLIEPRLQKKESKEDRKSDPPTGSY